MITYMSFYFNILMVLSSAWCYQNDDLLFKIEHHEIIDRTTLARVLGNDLSDYEDVFMGSGDIGKTEKIFVGIIHGIQKDTIYHLLVKFEKGHFSLLQEHPHATFYRKDGIIRKKYMLGRIRVNRYSRESHCVEVSTDKFEPIQIDTLTNKFSYRICRVLTHKKITLCPIGASLLKD